MTDERELELLEEMYDLKKSYEKKISDLKNELFYSRCNEFPGSVYFFVLHNSNQDCNTMIFQDEEMLFSGKAAEIPLKLCERKIKRITPFLHIAEGTGETTAFIKLEVKNED